jgi:hypothetical protein
LGAKRGLNCSDHALAFKPLKAAFKALEITVAGGIVRAMFRDCMLMLAIGRLPGPRMIGVEISAIERTS